MSCLATQVAIMYECLDLLFYKYTLSNSSSTSPDQTLGSKCQRLRLKTPTKPQLHASMLKPIRKKKEKIKKMKTRRHRKKRIPAETKRYYHPTLLSAENERQHRFPLYTQICDIRSRLFYEPTARHVSNMPSSMSMSADSAPSQYISLSMSMASWWPLVSSPFTRSELSSSMRASGSIPSIQV